MRITHLDRVAAAGLAAFLTAGANLIAQSGQPVAATTQQSSNTLAVAHPSGQTLPQLARRDAPYLVREGDLLDLNFPLCPEFNQELTVQPDGQLELRGVGPVEAAGRSLGELTAAVTAAYAGTMRKPEIAVTLKDAEKPYFIAAGQVARPGKYDLRTPWTVTEAVAIAGGLSDSAQSSQVVVFRPVGREGYKTQLVNLKKLLAEKDLNEDMRLAPGDVLYVPRNKMSRVKPYIPSSNVFLNPFGY